MPFGQRTLKRVTIRFVGQICVSAHIPPKGGMHMKNPLRAFAVRKHLYETTSIIVFSIFFNYDSTRFGSQNTR